MISKYCTIQEAQMENLMHKLGVPSVARKKGEVALRNTKINISTMSSDLNNECQYTETWSEHQQPELASHQSWFRLSSHD